MKQNKLKNEDKKMDIEKAKKSWEGKGITKGGLAVIGGWIETLASVGPRDARAHR